MKNIITSLLIFLFSSCYISSPKAKYSMKYASFISVDSTKLSFGKIPCKKEKCSKSILCTNKSNKAIYISSIRAGCSCISYIYPKGIMKPEETFSISIVYHTDTQKGFFYKRILVILNDGEFFYLLPITGTIQ